MSRTIWLLYLLYAHVHDIILRRLRRRRALACVNFLFFIDRSPLPHINIKRLLLK